MRTPAPKSQSVKCRAFLVPAGLVLALWALAFPAAAFPAARGSVHVWFLADGEPVSVPRSGATIASAVEQLLGGPPAVGRPRGIRSAVPRATTVRSVTGERRLVTVDLG